MNFIHPRLSLSATCLIASTCIATAEEYRGKFTPDLEYVLSGQLAKDTGPLPEMPYHYISDEEGFDSSRLTPVPAPGVHPRVLMSPEDIVRIRGEVAKSDQADRYFRIIWADVQAQAKRGDTLSMALQALVTEDEELGRKAAEQVIEKAKFFEPMIDLMNSHPDMDEMRDNWYYYARTTLKKVGGVYYKDAYDQGGADLIHKLAKESVEFASDGDKQSSGALFNTDIAFYDYAHKYMSEAERSIVRRVISKLATNRYTSGMELPGNLFINNHMSMGEDLILLALAIEGEEGEVDPRLLEQYAISVGHKINYDVSLGGLLHEKCKGFLPERATIAIGRRLDKTLLRHNHLQLMAWGKIMDSNNVFQRYANLPNAAPLGEGLEEDRFWWQGRGSGPWMDQFFNWAFVIKHYYPNDPAIDYFYKSQLRAVGLGAAGTDPSEKLPTPRIRYTHRDVMLMTATDGLRNEDGTVIDYDKQGLPKEITDRTPLLVDMARGVGITRASWDPDALAIHYEARSDVYSAGHETPEAGDFNLVADGIEWSARSLWYMDAYFRNTVLVDGYAGIYSPVAAEFLAANDTEQGTTFISDNTNQYNWRKHEKLFYLWHPAIKTKPGHMGPFSRHGMNMTREWELPFQDHMKEFQENLTGLDWGNWHGETRGPEMYSQWNHLDHAYRTLHMAKGEAPYVLLIDDIRKDDQERQYDWVMSLGPDVTLASADSSVRGRYLEKGMPENRSTDVILCLKDTKEERVQRYGLKADRIPQKGDPMLLVRTLWRNSTYAFPQPAFEQGYGPGRVIIPAKAVDPEFRVLLFPFRHGDQLPISTWNDDRTKLTVSVGGNTDVYAFGKTDNERTVFTVVRNGERAGSIAEGPASPTLDSELGWTPDRNLSDENRKVVFNESTLVALTPADLGNTIHYTTDGSEPTAESDAYNAPVELTKSCTFKARTFARYWPHRSDNGSNTLTIEYVDTPLAKAVKAPAKSTAGLECATYEIRRTIFNEKTGIFTGKKVMMPELAAHQPLATYRTHNFDIPKVDPATEATEMKKAFYAYKGFITVPDDGIYNLRLNSCGPIQLSIGGQSVISVTGSYGLSQKDRFGQAALSAGMHPIELTVTDPIFWQGERADVYEIEVAMMAPNAHTYAPIAASALTSKKSKIDFQPAPKVPHGKAVKVGKTLPGLVLMRYDRSDRYRIMPENGYSLDHFDTEKEAAYEITPSLSIDACNTAGRVDQYTGYFYADTDGIYEFALDRKGGNQLLIDGHEIIRNSIAAASLPGIIELDQGWHAFTLRLSGSKPTVSIKVPGASAYQAATTGSFSYPAETQPFDDQRLVAHVQPQLLKGDQLKVDGEATAILRFSEIVESERGPALKLNGGESAVEVEGLESPNDAFTIATWVKLNSKREVIWIENSWSSFPGARLRGYNMQAEYFRGSPRAQVNIEPFGAKEDKWIHVAVVYSEKVEIYINGELENWSPKTEVTRTAHVSDLKLFKGLDGLLQDIRLYNKSLNAEEVKAISAQ